MVFDIIFILRDSAHTLYIKLFPISRYECPLGSRVYPDPPVPRYIKCSSGVT